MPTGRYARAGSTRNPLIDPVGADREGFWRPLRGRGLARHSDLDMTANSDIPNAIVTSSDDPVVTTAGQQMLGFEHPSGKLI